MAHIDTLKYFQELKASGKSDDEAIAHVYTINTALSDLPTKEDLKKFATKDDMLLLSRDFHCEIENLKADIGSKLGILTKLVIAIFLAALAPLIKIFFSL